MHLQGSPDEHSERGPSSVAWALAMFGVFVLAAVAAVVVRYVMVCGISAADRTLTNIDVAAGGLEAYRERTGHLPPMLSDLGADWSARADGFTDGWGRPIRYQLSADGYGVLRSSGRDGRWGTSDDWVARVSPEPPDIDNPYAMLERMRDSDPHVVGGTDVPTIPAETAEAVAE